MNILLFFVWKLSVQYSHLNSLKTAGIWMVYMGHYATRVKQTINIYLSSKGYERLIPTKLTPIRSSMVSSMLTFSHSINIRSRWSWVV